MNNSNMTKLAMWGVVLLILFMVISNFTSKNLASGATIVGYSDFLDDVKSKRIKEATFDDSTFSVVGITQDGKKIKAQVPRQERGLVKDLVDNNIKFDAKAPDEPSFLEKILWSYGPILLLIGVWIFFMRQMQGGGKGGAFSFGKSKARMLDETNNHVTFADVAGCDEAKEEVSEVVDFLRDPSKFQKLGGRIPRGSLWHALLW